MAPHRLGRAVIVLCLAAVFLAAAAVTTAVTTAPTSKPEEDLVAFAPIAPDPTLDAVVTVVDTPQAVVAPSTQVVAPTTQVVAASTQNVVPTPAPTPTRVLSSDTQFERVLRPLLLEAKRRRQVAAAADPTYWTRNDPRLNATRLNFLLFGYGETHEPPLTERAFIGSFTIFSYDYATRQIDLVSLTHDIRAPEAERYMEAQNGEKVGPIKIDRSYSVGGFDLMRRTLEDATGLVIDYQLAFKESAIAGATDSVFGGLDVEVPLAFNVNGFYLDGVKYPGGEFPQGMQHLSGMQVIQFIKTVPVEEHYDARLEHNARKHLVFRSLMDAMRQHVGDVTFLGKAALFFTSQVADDSIAYDFDLRSLLVDNLRGMMADFTRPESRDKQVPSVNRTIYVVDPASGDGGVQWVTANAHDNPITRRDIDQHVYGEMAMEVPYHADPYTDDLPGHYWSDVRQLLARKLANQ